VDIGAITGRLKPASDGLQIAADSDVLAKLRELQANKKLRALLDRATRAIDNGKVMDALTDVDAALEIDPANVAALVLAARCWYALGKFDAALDLLATARTHARNTDEVTAVLRWRETCELGLLEAVSANWAS